MAQEGSKRKLTAILSADVVGYSRLMDDNEEATIRTLNIYCASMTTLIQKHSAFMESGLALYVSSMT